MKVYVIRHGESEANQKGVWAGWTDVHLTEDGKKQAQSIRYHLKTDFDKIFSSDLTRAKETAENAIERCHYETSPLLREINVGTLANKPLSCVTQKEKTYIRENGYSLYGGESKEDIKKRVREFKKKLETSNLGNIAVFTHNGWMRTFFDEIMEVKIPWEKIGCKNCTLAIFEYEDNKWKLHSWINLI